VVLRVALEKLPFFWDMMPQKLINFNNALEELAASLVTVCTVTHGSYVSERTIESEYKIKDMKILVAIEIK
jgi:HD superfamily phosphohydrolase YqeK